MSATLVQAASNRLCYTINQTNILGNAIKKLVDHKIGALPVVDEDKKLRGIISERDIIRELYRSNFFHTRQVEDIMTKNVITCSLSSRANEIMEVMTENKIRHVPITEGNELIGIVSIGDVVSRLLEKYKNEAEVLRYYINS